MRRPRTRSPVSFLAGLLLVIATVSSAPAQENQPVCCARFNYILEKTIFKVDAVRLDLTIRDETPNRVAELVAGRADPRAWSDSVAAMYLGADHAQRPHDLPPIVRPGSFSRRQPRRDGEARESRLAHRGGTRATGRGEPGPVRGPGRGWHSGWGCDRARTTRRHGHHPIHGRDGHDTDRRIPGRFRRSVRCCWDPCSAPNSEFRNGLLDLVFTRAATSDAGE